MSPNFGNVRARGCVPLRAQNRAISWVPAWANEHYQAGRVTFFLTLLVIFRAHVTVKNVKNVTLPFQQRKIQNVSLTK